MKQIAAALHALAILIFTIFPLPTHAADSEPAFARTALQGKIEALAKRAQPGLFGIAILDLQNGDAWRVNADRAYPMMSVFKLPVAAAVLARIDRGDLSLNQRTQLTRADLRSGPINDSFRGEKMTFTVRELLGAAVSRSDNSAVDALIKLIGGPQVVTGFLRDHAVEGMRVDLDEAGIGRVFEHESRSELSPNETSAQENQRLHRDYQAFLIDPRNRSTPVAAVSFLRKLWRKELLSTGSTQLLLELMAQQTSPRRLRAGLPENVELADKCGTSYTLDGHTAAFNDIGILSWPDGHAVIIAAFLTDSRALPSERDALFAELARDTARALGSSADKPSR